VGNRRASSPVEHGSIAHTFDKVNLMMRIDCQSHVFPPAYAELLTRSRGMLRAASEQGQYTIDYAGLHQAQLVLDAYAPAAKLRAMDAAKIDFAVLSVNMPGPEWLDEDLAILGARCCNDYVAEQCALHPDRFAGLACLPLSNVPAALEEMNRAVGELKLRGVVLYSHIQGRPIDSPEFEPLFARAQALDLPIVLHPSAPTWGSVLQDYSMIPMIGFMIDTSIAMLRLILGGVMECYPNLTIVHPHAGGVLPYLMGRVVEQTEIKGRGRERITLPPDDYYRRVYFDLVTPSQQAVEFAYRFASADRLVFGSDHPWVDPQIFIRLVDGLPITVEERAKIYSENAIRLFHL
jgi:predicted TIM-barrel fold metal-dependent hydrolase